MWLGLQTRTATSLALLVVPAVASAETERGVFGVTVAVTADGWFNPTVKVARITEVQRDLPAYRAGIAPGDEVVELDGKRIPGAKAIELRPLAKGKRVGERLAVVLQRPDGTSYSAVLVAERPAR